MIRIAMAQWVNRLWNNIFVNPPSLPLPCETSGVIHLVVWRSRPEREARGSGVQPYHVATCKISLYFQLKHFRDVCLRLKHGRQ